MKVKKGAVITASTFLLSMVFSFWLQFESDDRAKMPVSLLLLNTKYGVYDAESLSDKEVDLYGTARFQTNVTIPVRDPEAPSQRLIVKLRDEEGGSNNENLENVFVLEMQGNVPLDKVIEEYEKVPVVEYAEPDYDIDLDFVDTRPGVRSVLDDQKKVLSGLPGDVIVAVVDSGVDADHIDLQGRISRGWDVLSESGNADDRYGHGTHVAGILLSYSDDAQVLPIKFTNGNDGSLSNLVRGIKYAADNGSQVLNLSLGLVQEPRLMRDAISYAHNKGVIIVAAAGNNGNEQKYFPAAWPEVIAVTALDDKGDRFVLSNYGEWVEFSSPGQDIYSTAPENGYAYRSGTSQAAPVVTAAVANIIGGMEDVTLDSIRDYLNEYSEPSKDKKLGRKIVDRIEVEETLEIEVVEEEFSWNLIGDEGIISNEAIPIIRDQLDSQNRNRRIRFTDLYGR